MSHLPPLRKARFLRLHQIFSKTKNIQTLLDVLTCLQTKNQMKRRPNEGSYTSRNDFQWDTITNGTTCPNEMINNFYNKIWPIFDECFPVIKTRVSSRDPPFLSPIVKHLLKLRKNAVNKRDNECSHRLQEKMNKLIRVNQLKAVKQENKIRDRGSKRWWSLVNKITGRGNSEVPLSHITD